MSEEHRFRKRTFHVHLSDTEFQLLTDKASYCNISRSEFVRKMIRDGAVISYQPFELKEVCYELNRIGNNINQIAYQANASGNFTDGGFKHLKAEYEKLLALYLEKVIKG